MTGVLVLLLTSCSWAGTPEDPAPGATPLPVPAETPRHGRRGPSVGIDPGRARIVELSFENTTRRYRVVVPDGGGENLPVVVVFHGGGEDTTGARAEQWWPAPRDLLLVFPDGVDGTWRLRGEGGDGPDTDPLVDVRFARAVIDDLAERYSVDRSRVYATGFSNGGMLVWELACSDPEPYAGFAAVAASMTQRTLEACQPSAGRPFLYVHGTADPRFDGGRTGLDRVPGGIELTGHARTLEAASRVFRCRGLTSPEELDPCPGDGLRIRRQQLEECGSMARFTYVELQGMGHKWPRAVPGRCADFDASDEIISYFQL